jgi:hypothetical protein
MNQGGDRDVFGGTRRGSEIDKMLDSRAARWAKSSSNMHQPPPPSDAGEAPSDAGYQYFQLGALPGPEAPRYHNAKSVIPSFVRTEVGTPDFVTYRSDRQRALFSGPPTQNLQFGHSLIPIHEDPMDDTREALKFSIIREQ